MTGKVGSILLSLALPLSAAHAQDTPLRLPGQGELKSELPQVKGIGRLIPGGGLLLSFDADQDGLITPQEVETGIVNAFVIADTNQDGRMTPIEQIRWTESLPTRDVSLANPARFDPNLDRSVRNEEFTEIILAFAADHADEATGIIPVTNLKSDQIGRLPQEEPEFAPQRAEKEVEEDKDTQTRGRSSSRRNKGSGS